MSDVIDVTKLKVPELRVELSKKGLNTFGTRQVLIDRLSEALGIDLNAQIKAAEADAAVSNGNSDKSQESKDTAPNERHTDASAESVPVSADHKRKRSPTPPRRTSPSRSPRGSPPRNQESRRSPSNRSRSPSTRDLVCPEVDDWERSENVFLDGYNSDLSLIIDKDGYSAKPLSNGGFAMMWAGARANYGILNGKAYFEVKADKFIEVDNCDSMSGGSTHVMRVGWSTQSSGFRLGEEPNSYGYGGTAKKSCNNQFTDYGCKFGEGDVVGAFIESTATNVKLYFSVNGVDQGECYSIPIAKLEGEMGLFPHIYVKNVAFSVNFGQDEQPPWFPHTGNNPLEWRQMTSVAITDRIHGRKPPPSKSECEIIMMVGLPGAGKTYYADQLCAKHPEKQYNILGTNFILDKMKVIGLSRRRNYAGRWDVLIDKSTKCLNTLISIASKRRRNCVLDQTNVYPSAQRRKMRPFDGFKRRAIVIVPSDDEFRRRIALREKEEGKEVPESAVLEMKANFAVPVTVSEDKDSVFNEVEFPELGREEAVRLIEQYNKEGQSTRQPTEKRQRWDGNRDRGESGDRSRGGYDGRNSRDNYRRSPDRRDDSRGPREYRGGYNASRDRSYDSGRGYDRGGDRDSYGGRPERFPSRGQGRFQSAPRGGGPPMPGGYGGFNGPPRRGMAPPRGGRGGGFEGSDFRSSEDRPRGRGGYHGASGLDSSRDSSMNSYQESDYEPSFGGGRGRGMYQRGSFNRDAPGPRGASSNHPYQSGPPPVSNMSGPTFGGGGDSGYERGRTRFSGPSLGPPASGGAYSDQGKASESPSGPPSGYPPRGGANMRTNSTYPGPNQGPSRGGYQPPQQNNYQSRPPAPFAERYPGPPGGYQGPPPSSYRPANPPSAPQPPQQAGVPPRTSSFNNPDPRGGYNSGGTNQDSMPDRAQPPPNSLYASGASRFSENRPAPSQPPPRQSRFDSKPQDPPASAPAQYSAYPPGQYQSGGGYQGGYGSAPPPSQSAPAARTGRSRFEPAQTQPAMPAVHQPTQQPPSALSQSQVPQTQQQQPQSQAYGYGYGTSPVKPSQAQPPQAQPSQQAPATAAPPNQQAYGAYGYGYGHPSSYGGQAPQTAAPPQRPPTTMPSLYASAVAANKPTQQQNAPSQHAPMQQTGNMNVGQQQQPAVGQQTGYSSSAPSAASAVASNQPSYASYYYNQGAMPTQQPQQAAVSQYGTWGQQASQMPASSPATAASTASTPASNAQAAAAYANYYAAAYSAYPGYAAAGQQSQMPSTGAPAAAPAAPQAPSNPQQQYYAGYR